MADLDPHRPAPPIDALVPAATFAGPAIHLIRPAIHVTVSAINGFPAEALINASADADLVVVGTRGGGGFPHLHLGGVSSQVVHHAKCPVVVVPHAR